MKVFEITLQGRARRGRWQHTMLVPAETADEAKATLDDYLLRLGGKTDWTVQSIKEVEPVKLKETHSHV